MIHRYQSRMERNGLQELRTGRVTDSVPPATYYLIARIESRIEEFKTMEALAYRTFWRNPLGVFWPMEVDSIIGQAYGGPCILGDMDAAATKLSDAEIAARVLEGDVEAFEVVLERHRRRVFGIVGRRVPREDVEEVAQDVFVRAYTSLGSYGGRGDFGSWMAKIAVRTCYDYWRERYRSRELPMSSLSEEQAQLLANAATDESSRASVDAESLDEARELLAWAMARLSPEDRAVLELVHLEERPVREAAELLGWSVVNVKVRAYRARKKLRAILAEALADRGGTK